MRVCGGIMRIWGIMSECKVHEGINKVNKEGV